MFADSLQSRINALTTDFVNRDDPAQRAKIEADRKAALAELERVKKELDEQTKAIAAIEEEAPPRRRARRLAASGRVSARSILLVEDKDSLRAMLKLALESQGHHVIEARDEPEAVAALRDSQPALVLSDLRLPKGDGMGVLRAVKELDAELPVIVMTAHGSIQDAVEAMKQGALDFLAKPVDPDHLLLLVSRALEQRRLLTEYRLLKEEAAARRGGPSIIGDSPALRQVMAAIDRAAGTDTTVLLEGESGTGKELCARALHNAQRPRQRAVRGDQLRGDSREPARGRAVRLRARRVHRRQRSARSASSRWRSAAPSSSTRSARCRWRCRPRCCARSRPSASSGSAATPRSRSTSASSRRPTGMLRQAVAARQFREDLYFRLSVFPVDGAAAARAQGRHSEARASLRRARARATSARRSRCRRRRWRCWSSIPGPATFASCRTRSSAR